MNIPINGNMVYPNLMITLLRDYDLYNKFKAAILNNEPITINDKSLDVNELFLCFKSYGYYPDIISLLGYFGDQENYNWDKAITSRNKMLSIFPIASDWKVNESIIDTLNEDEIFKSLKTDFERAIYIYLFLCLKLKFDDSYYENDEYKIVCSPEELESVNSSNNLVICFSFSVIFHLLIDIYCQGLDKRTISAGGKHYFNLINNSNSLISFDGTNNRVKDFILVKSGNLPKGITYFLDGKKYEDEIVNKIFKLFCDKYKISYVGLK